MAPALKVAFIGNIGSGKTTLLKVLHDIHPYAWIDEPVDEWRTAIPNKNIFELALNGETDDLISFQYYNMIFAMRAWLIADTLCDELVIGERDMNSQEIFWRALYDRKDISEAHYLTLQESLEMISEIDLVTEVDLLVYVKASPQKCFERASTRDRPEERNYTLDYFDKLNGIHECYVANSDIPVWTVDNENRSLDEMKLQMTRLMYNILRLAEKKSGKTLQNSLTVLQNFDETTY